MMWFRIHMNLRRQCLNVYTAVIWFEFCFWIYMNLSEFTWISTDPHEFMSIINMNSLYQFIWIYMGQTILCGSARQCGSASGVSGNASYASSSVWQCARQCARSACGSDCVAVFLVVYGSACGSVRLSGSVAVWVVCGSVRQCDSSVRQCGRKNVLTAWVIPLTFPVADVFKLLAKTHVVEARAITLGALEQNGRIVIL
jgi:hypothetical protein